jgi:hypothetical protein
MILNRFLNCTVPVIISVTSFTVRIGSRCENDQKMAAVGTCSNRYCNVVISENTFSKQRQQQQLRLVRNVTVSILDSSYECGCLSRMFSVIELRYFLRTQFFLTRSSILI